MIIASALRINDIGRPWRREGAGIFDCEVDADLVLRDFSVALDNPKPICVGRSQAIDLGFVGHAECIDDERIAIPMPNGMSVRAPLKIVWMSHIHMDNSGMSRSMLKS